MGPWQGCDVQCRCRSRNMQGASLYTRACRDEAAEMYAECHVTPVHCSIIELAHLGRLVHVEGEVLEVRQRVQQWRHAACRHRLLLAVSDVAEPATHRGYLFQYLFQLYSHQKCAGHTRADCMQADKHAFTPGACPEES